MNQDPDGDVADVIRNSVSTSYRGTPVGTMTSADLVDGKIGKAINFDGSDDYIDVVNGFGMDGLGAFSVSVKCNSVPLLLSKGSSPHIIRISCATEPPKFLTRNCISPYLLFTSING